MPLMSLLRNALMLATDGSQVAVSCVFVIVFVVLLLLTIFQSSVAYQPANVSSIAMSPISPVAAALASADRGRQSVASVLASAFSTCVLVTFGKLPR